MAQTQSSASSSGFHFFQLYQCCPRKFYFKYVVGLDTKWTPPALVYGAAFHEAKAEFYRTGNMQDGRNAGIAFIEANKENYQEPEAYEKDLYRLPILYRTWVVKWGLNDLIKYDVVTVEQEFEVVLPNGFKYTGRPDTILQDKVTKEYFIMETKTSGFSKDLTMDTVYYGDQVTSYYVLSKAGLDIEAAGVICDVAYWNKNAKYEDNIDCLRSDPITRTREEIDDFVDGVAQLFSELSQKIAALETHKPEALFQRNTYYCMSYGKPCEFVDICRTRVRPQDPAPFGFIKKTEVRKLSDKVADSLAVS